MNIDILQNIYILSYQWVYWNGKTTKHWHIFFYVTRKVDPYIFQINSLTVSYVRCMSPFGSDFLCLFSKLICPQIHPIVCVHNVVSVSFIFHFFFASSQTPFIVMFREERLIVGLLNLATHIWVALCRFGVNVMWDCS